MIAKQLGRDPIFYISDFKARFRVKFSLFRTGVSRGTADSADKAETSWDYLTFFCHILHHI